MFGQFEFSGLFGKITSRPNAGDLAPEIGFTKVLSGPGGSVHFDGQVTVLLFLPYVSGNLDSVNRWNTLVEEFVEKPVQFVWIAGESEVTLLPFLQEHPIKGWLLNDPDGGIGRSYGLETLQVVIVGADRRIVGFDQGMLFRKEIVTAVLEDRITTIPPEPTLESVMAFSKTGRELLSAEAQRRPRPDDYRPDFSPSYTVHIAPAKIELGGGNYSGMGYWSLQGYTIRRLLAELLEVSPTRIDLPASIDLTAQYDFSIVLPKTEDKHTMRVLIRQGAEDYFQLAGSHENRLRDVYVLTAPEPKLHALVEDPLGAGGFAASIDFLDIDIAGLAGERRHAIEAVGGLSMVGATMDDFCRMLERSLDRPLINETRLEGRFNFQLQDCDSDFVERLRDELGLAITRAQRNVGTMVYRLR